MQKGGYQIIDLKNKELTSGVGMTYEGIYDKIEGTRKAILVSGLNLEGTEYHDSFVDFTVNNTVFEGTIFGNAITISDEDVVTVTEPEPEQTT